MAETFPWIILFLPLLAAGSITLLCPTRRELSARLSIGAVVAAFWLSFLLWFAADLKQHVATETAFEWFSVDNLVVAFGLRLDRLSELMLLVVTGVAGAIHIYSYSYMAEDRDVPRYFASLSLFTFAMLGIVLANNFVLMFVFWELVGLSSYLLIGFWFERPAAADAGKKAFLANRIGDTGFLLGIILLWSATGSVHFGTIQQLLHEHPKLLGEMSTIIGLLIFCGAVGKSAQFPLHVWLPDAMEGPTPVSALIHAATMVAAGIFMLCRVFFVFQAESAMPLMLAGLSGISALDVIAAIGMITALLAALMAVQQNDIKRILAYSTLSQLGLMVLAVGCWGPLPAMFHLTTHAFFKALLFLGAGAVIHAMHHEQDIWRMGGLGRKMPVTAAVFLAATLALCGLPPFSGFYSKDAILACVLKQNMVLFLAAVATSVLTAFYMFRLVFVAFAGKPRTSEAGHAHEAPALMLYPMLFLVVPSVLAGFWSVEPYLEPLFSAHAATAVKPWYEQLLAPFDEPLAAFAGLGAAGFGIFAAATLYLGAREDSLPSRWGAFARVLRNRFYIDEIYRVCITLGLDAVAAILDFFDRWILAGVIVRGLHGTVELTGRILRLFQTGNLHTYGFMFGLGVIITLWLALMR
jgi:NADH-quinone oxidoreductase subunit L